MRADTGIGVDHAERIHCSRAAIHRISDLAQQEYVGVARMATRARHATRSQVVGQQVCVLLAQQNLALFTALPAHVQYPSLHRGLVGGGRQPQHFRIAAARRDQFYAAQPARVQQRRRYVQAQVCRGRRQRRQLVTYKTPLVLRQAAARAGRYAAAPTAYSRRYTRAGEVTLVDQEFIEGRPRGRRAAPGR